MSLPRTRVSNNEIVARVRAAYRGSTDDWPKLESAIYRVFGLCNTQQRYLDPDAKARVADYAVQAARHCLSVNDTTLDEVDLLICGGIARQYFEPATAMEVAAKLGLHRTHAFDVTSACVGHLEALQSACAYLSLHKHYRSALICTSELTGNFLSYDIQNVVDLQHKAAGLTIGNAAACLLLRRAPGPKGSIRLSAITTYTLPEHWELCQAPIDGTLSSSSVELMRLSRLITPRLTSMLAELDWAPNEVEHYVFHQPSEVMVRKVLQGMGADTQRAIYTHHLYGNTTSASVGLAFHELCKQRNLRPGDKFVLGSAAAGFTMTVAAGRWIA
ncbi:MAG: 3-oxoacyl-[acyl-carrier-protein] synthase III C-terminal domain-containing protein [Nannocystaceae bacterium]